MKKTPLFSIITINYNNVRGLEQTVLSIANQTNKDFEYVIIDGDSNDGSKNIIERYKNIIQFWVSEPDKGIYHAMNKGLDLVTGKYCLFLNSGDWLVDNSVMAKVNQIKDDSDFLIFQMIKTLKTGENKSTSLIDITLDRLTESSLPHQSTFIRTTLLKSFGGYNTDYKIVADWEFFIKAILIKNSSYKVFQMPIAYFDMTGISNNTEQRELLLNERLVIKDKLLNKIIWKAGKELLDNRIKTNSKTNSFYPIMYKLKKIFLRQ